MPADATQNPPAECCPAQPEPPRRTLAGRAAGGVLVLLARLYQCTLSPVLGPLCRYEPSCSNYFIQAVEKYGPLHGSIKGVRRLCRCHPLSRGSWHDPP